MKKFLTKLYAYTFFSDFVLIYPLYAIMFGDLGVSALQIGILLAGWSATAFILEVPSGALADKYPRKNLLFIGHLIRSAGYLCWLVFPSFTGFLIGMILWGVESALSSGTYEALLYDELKKFKQESQFTKIYGRCKSIAFLAILLASGLASLAILAGYNFVLILSAVSVFLASLFAISLPKAPSTKSTKEKEYFKILKKGLTKVARTPRLIHLITILSLTWALYGGLEEFYGIFADEAKLPLYFIGIYLGLVSAFEGIATFFAHRFEKKPEKHFYILMLLSGITLLLIGHLFSYLSLILIIIFNMGMATIATVYEGKIQHSIKSDARATITSVSGFFSEIGALIVYLSVGLIAQNSGYNISFFTYGVIISLLGIFYLLKSSFSTS